MAQLDLAGFFFPEIAAVKITPCSQVQHLTMASAADLGRGRVSAASTDLPKHRSTRSMETIKTKAWFDRPSPVRTSMDAHSRDRE